MITISAADLSAADSQPCQIKQPNKSHTTKITQVCDNNTTQNKQVKKNKKAKSNEKNYFGFFKLLIPDTLR